MSPLEQMNVEAIREFTTKLGLKQEDQTKIEMLIIFGFNAAIDHINALESRLAELEARYEGHFHSTENTVTGDQEPGHTHTLSIALPLQAWQPDTTPPIEDKPNE